MLSVMDAKSLSDSRGGNQHAKLSRVGQDRDMTIEARDRVLVLVKATPQPSRQYGDTVCVAGVDMRSATHGWIRLYPVPFRYLEGDRQFKKYDIVLVRTRDAGADKRPESRKIDAATIEVVQHLDGWRRRTPWIEPLAGPSMCELIAATRADINAHSLAAIRPANVVGLQFTKHPGWSPDELRRFEEYRQQGDLFSETPPQLLDAPPWIVHLVYRCRDARCAGHQQRIIDWELTALQARYRARSEEELKGAVRHNFFEIPFASGRSPLIFVGNQEDVRRRASFTVLGLYYPKVGDVEQTTRLF